MQYSDEELKALQQIELETLSLIDRICRNHDLQYFLDGGTALGARRHGGFIPWDDDVDVGMPRNDYEAFLKVAPSELPSNYKLVEPHTNKNLAGMFAKVWRTDSQFATKETIDAGIDQGIFVDIFPYDVLHSEPLRAAKQVSQLRRWQRTSYLYHSSHITVPHKGFLGVLENLACKIAHGFVRLLENHNSIVEHFDRWALLGSDSASDYWINPIWSHIRFKTETLFPVVPYLFEGEEFFVPHHIEDYLVAQYGSDWNELPPVEERRNHAPVKLVLPSDFTE